jgi:DNA-binding transcriptional ArsR family regulator
MEEETYSVIFTSLKHPVRRRILRMLADKSLTFSEIQESLAIDSGHLSYHLESLSDLIAHTQDGKYRLSTIGTAAVKLMGGVEEHRPSYERLKPKQIMSKVYPFILVGALLIASLYAINYAALAAPTITELVDSASGTPVYIHVGQTLEFNITIEHTPSGIVVVAGLGLNTNSVQKTIPIGNTIASEGGTLRLFLGLNLTNAIPGSYYLSMAPNNQTEITDNGTVITVNPNGVVFYPTVATPFLPLIVEEPNGTTSTRAPQTTLSDLGSVVVSWPRIEAAFPGTYRFEITNWESRDLNGDITPYVTLQFLEKPFFYYGIAGLVIALGYVAVVTVSMIYVRRQGTSIQGKEIMTRDTLLSQ